MKRRVNISRMFKLGTPIDDAMNQGVHDALLRHKKLGQSVVGWRDGKVVWIPAEEIVVPELKKSTRRRPVAKKSPERK